MAETSGPDGRGPARPLPPAAGEARWADVVPLRRTSWRQCAIATFLGHLRWYRGSPTVPRPLRPRDTSGWDRRRDHPSWGSPSPDDVA